MEEPAESPHPDQELSQTEQQGRKTRKVRVRRSRQPQVDPCDEHEAAVPDTESPKKRIVQVAKKIKQKKPYEDPIPGSIEEDFLLEDQDDKACFFAVGDIPPEQVVRYDTHGDRIDYEDYQEQMTSPGVPGDKTSSQGAANTGGMLSWGRKSTMLVQEPELSPEEKLEQKLREIEEGKIKEEALTQQYEASLAPGIKIILNKQNKILKKHEQMMRYWGKLTSNIASKLNVDVGELAFNRAQLYRERIEEMDFLDRAYTPDEKAGLNAWYMSLRSSKNSSNPREIYL